MDKPLLPTGKIRKSILTKVAGVTFKCQIDSDEKRQEVLEAMSEGDHIEIRPYTYRGSKAYLVVDPEQDLDIGNLPGDVADEVSEFENPEFEGYIAELDSFCDDDDNEVWYAKIRLFVL